MRSQFAISEVAPTKSISENWRSLSKPKPSPSPTASFILLQRKRADNVEVLLVFVEHPGVEPTNNRSERNTCREAEIRKGARTRKTEAGAERSEYSVAKVVETFGLLIPGRFQPADTTKSGRLESALFRTQVGKLVRHGSSVWQRVRHNSGVQTDKALTPSICKFVDINSPTVMTKLGP